MANAYSGRPFYIDLDPIDATWEEWSSSFAYLFDSQAMPYVPELEWRDFAAQIESLPVFGVVGLPDSNFHNTWQEWADDLITVANGVVYA